MTYTNVNTLKINSNKLDGNNIPYGVNITAQVAMGQDGNHASVVLVGSAYETCANTVYFNGGLLLSGYNFTTGSTSVPYGGGVYTNGLSFATDHSDVFFTAGATCGTIIDGEVTLGSSVNRIDISGSGAIDFKQTLPEQVIKIDAHENSGGVTIDASAANAAVDFYSGSAADHFTGTSFGDKCYSGSPDVNNDPTIELVDGSYWEAQSGEAHILLPAGTINPTITKFTTFYLLGQDGETCILDLTGSDTTDATSLYYLGGDSITVTGLSNLLNIAVVRNATTGGVLKLESTSTANHVSIEMATANSDIAEINNLSFDIPTTGTLNIKTDNSQWPTVATTLNIPSLTTRASVIKVYANNAQGTHHLNLDSLTTGTEESPTVSRITVSNGAATFGGDVKMAQSEGGSQIEAGSDITFTGNLDLATSNSAVLSISDTGLITIDGALYIAEYGEGTSTVNMQADSRLNVHNIYVNTTNDATVESFVVNTGSLTVNEAIIVPCNIKSYLASGNGFATVDTLKIGSDNTGAFTFSNSTTGGGVFLANNLELNPECSSNGLSSITFNGGQHVYFAGTVTALGSGTLSAKSTATGGTDIGTLDASDFSGLDMISGGQTLLTINTLELGHDSNSPATTNIDGVATSGATINALTTSGTEKLVVSGYVTPPQSGLNSEITQIDARQLSNGLTYTTGNVDVTIYGTLNGDTITTGNQGSSVFSNGGADSLTGGSGNDIFDSGSGHGDGYVQGTSQPDAKLANSSSWDGNEGTDKAYIALDCYTTTPNHLDDFEEVYLWGNECADGTSALAIDGGFGSPAIYLKGENPVILEGFTFMPNIVEGSANLPNIEVGDPSCEGSTSITLRISSTFPSVTLKNCYTEAQINGNGNDAAITTLTSTGLGRLSKGGEYDVSLGLSSDTRPTSISVSTGSGELSFTSNVQVGNGPSIPITSIAGSPITFGGNLDLNTNGGYTLDASLSQDKITVIGALSMTYSNDVSTIKVGSVGMELGTLNTNGAAELDVNAASSNAYLNITTLSGASINTVNVNNVGGAPTEGYNLALNGGISLPLKALTTEGTGKVYVNGITCNGDGSVVTINADAAYGTVIDGTVDAGGASTLAVQGTKTLVISEPLTSDIIIVDASANAGGITVNANSGTATTIYSTNNVDYLTGSDQGDTFYSGAVSSRVNIENGTHWDGGDAIDTAHIKVASGGTTTAKIDNFENIHFTSSGEGSEFDFGDSSLSIPLNIHYEGGGGLKLDGVDQVLSSVHIENDATATLQLSTLPESSSTNLIYDTAATGLSVDIPVDVDLTVDTNGYAVTIPTLTTGATTLNKESTGNLVINELVGNYISTITTHSSSGTLTINNNFVLSSGNNEILTAIITAGSGITFSGDLSLNQNMVTLDMSLGSATVAVGGDLNAQLLSNIKPGSGSLSITGDITIPGVSALTIEGSGGTISANTLLMAADITTNIASISANSPLTVSNVNWAPEVHTGTGFSLSGNSLITLGNVVSGVYNIDASENTGGISLTALSTGGVTVKGTRVADTITTSSTASYGDTIYTAGGADTIIAGAGNDTVHSGSYTDSSIALASSGATWDGGAGAGDEAHIVLSATATSAHINNFEKVYITTAVFEASSLSLTDSTLPEAYDLYYQGSKTLTFNGLSTAPANIYIEGDATIAGALLTVEGSYSDASVNIYCNVGISNLIFSIAGASDVVVNGGQHVQDINNMVLSDANSLTIDSTNLNAMPVDFLFSISSLTMKDTNLTITQNANDGAVVATLIGPSSTGTLLTMLGDSRLNITNALPSSIDMVDASSMTGGGATFSVESAAGPVTVTGSDYGDDITSSSYADQITCGNGDDAVSTGTNTLALENVLWDGSDGNDTATISLGSGSTDAQIDNFETVEVSAPNSFATLDLSSSTFSGATTVKYKGGGGLALSTPSTYTGLTLDIDASPGGNIRINNLVTSAIVNLNANMQATLTLPTITTLTVNSNNDGNYITSLSTDDVSTLIVGDAAALTIENAYTIQDNFGTSTITANSNFTIRSSLSCTGNTLDANSGTGDITVTQALSLGGAGTTQTVKVGGVTSAYQIDLGANAHTFVVHAENNAELITYDDVKFLASDGGVARVEVETTDSSNPTILNIEGQVVYTSGDVHTFEAAESGTQGTYGGNVNIGTVVYNTVHDSDQITINSAAGGTTTVGAIDINLNNAPATILNILGNSPLVITEVMPSGINLVNASTMTGGNVTLTANSSTTFYSTGYGDILTGSDNADIFWTGADSGNTPSKRLSAEDSWDALGNSAGSDAANIYLGCGNTSPIRLNNFEIINLWGEGSCVGSPSTLDLSSAQMSFGTPTIYLKGSNNINFSGVQNILNINREGYSSEYPYITYCNDCDGVNWSQYDPMTVNVITNPAPVYVPPINGLILVTQADAQTISVTGSSLRTLTKQDDGGPYGLTISLVSDTNPNSITTSGGVTTFDSDITMGDNSGISLITAGSGISSTYSLRSTGNTLEVNAADNNFVALSATGISSTLGASESSVSTIKVGSQSNNAGSCGSASFTLSLGTLTIGGKELSIQNSNTSPYNSFGGKVLIDTLIFNGINAFSTTAAISSGASCATTIGHVDNGIYNIETLVVKGSYGLVITNSLPTTTNLVDASDNSGGVTIRGSSTATTFYSTAHVDALTGGTNGDNFYSGSENSRVNIANNTNWDGGSGTDSAYIKVASGGTTTAQIDNFENIYFTSSGASTVFDFGTGGTASALNDLTNIYYEGGGDLTLNSVDSMPTTVHVKVDSTNPATLAFDTLPSGSTMLQYEVDASKLSVTIPVDNTLTVNVNTGRTVTIPTLSTDAATVTKTGAGDLTVTNLNGNGNINKITNDDSGSTFTIGNADFAMASGNLNINTITADSNITFTGNLALYSTTTEFDAVGNQFVNIEGALSGSALASVKLGTGSVITQGSFTMGSAVTNFEVDVTENNYPASFMVEQTGTFIAADQSGTSTVTVGTSAGSACSDYYTISLADLTVGRASDGYKLVTADKNADPYTSNFGSVYIGNLVFSTSNSGVFVQAGARCGTVVNTLGGEPSCTLTTSGTHALTVREFAFSSNGCSPATVTNSASGDTTITNLDASDSSSFAIEGSGTGTITIGNLTMGTNSGASTITNSASDDTTITTLDASSSSEVTVGGEGSGDLTIGNLIMGVDGSGLSRLTTATDIVLQNITSDNEQGSGLTLENSHPITVNAISCDYSTIYAYGTNTTYLDLSGSTCGYTVHTLVNFAPYSGNLHISGGDYSDTFYGSNYADTISGGDGNDVIYGENGNDILNGGNGDDILYGNKGYDTFTGGSGADIFFINDEESHYLIQMITMQNQVYKLSTSITLSSSNINIIMDFCSGATGSGLNADWLSIVGKNSAIQFGLDNDNHTMSINTLVASFNGATQRLQSNKAILFSINSTDVLMLFNGDQTSKQFFNTNGGFSTSGLLPILLKDAVNCTFETYGDESGDVVITGYTQPV